MRILHIYKDYPPVIGGIENHLRSLAEAQAKRGHQVTVLVTSLDGATSDINTEGVRVIRAARIAQIASTPLSLELFRWVRKLDPDITHLQFPYPLGEVAYQACGSGRLVVSYQSDIVRQRLILFFYRPLLKRLLARADRIIATSPGYVQSSMFLKPLRKKSRVVPLGIDARPFLESDRTRADSIRTRFGSPLVLFLGRLSYYKGIPYLLQAVKNLQVRLLIAGDGPKAQSWRRKSIELGLEGKVFFLGEVSEQQKPALYQACDLFVLPSSHRSEAFGTVLLEAMASGKAVVSTELATGTSFVNQHERTGLVVPPCNSVALREAIRKLVEDPRLRRRMEERARSRVLREFTLAKMISGIESVYEELMDPGEQ